jgi:hypothetical protein
MVPPVTPESIQRAKEETARDRESLFQQTGIRVTDDPVNPFRVIVTPRISAYRHVTRRSE